MPKPPANVASKRKEPANLASTESRRRDPAREEALIHIEPCPKSGPHTYARLSGIWRRFVD